LGRVPTVKLPVGDSALPGLIQLSRLAYRTMAVCAARGGLANLHFRVV
jgi:hypothetical protein